ncbi:MAG: hypothetical protein U5N26_03380 [Candidatus Marinimicrobia bacterium]|nr:hypothetical protein [Candidatus Neomarinimicrobiota bacterium]
MITEAKHIFDKESAAVRDLVAKRGWKAKNESESFAAIFDFVKNGIPFGMNKKGCIPASKVLEDGYGQALTKSILLKTLTEACGLLCRFHAFRIKKNLYEGLPRKIRYNSLPDTLISAWAELFYNGRWIVADGVILDDQYLEGLCGHISAGDGEFIGLGAGLYSGNTRHRSWDGENHSYCQRAAIVRDLGIIDDFEWFFSEYRADFRKLGKLASKHANRKIAAIRDNASA